MSEETNNPGQTDTTSPKTNTDTAGAKPSAGPAGNTDRQPETAASSPGAEPDPQAAAAGPDEAATSAPGPDPQELLRAQVKELEIQQAELAERLAAAQADIHRYQAEIQNLHRRREKEAEDAGKYAIAKFAKDTVEVADNFERAISSVPGDALEANPVLKSLLDGVTMTERAFLNVLERHGVKRVSPKDEPFDPHKHQAVVEQEDRNVPAGTVLQVYQAGYMIANRVLRPAMVVVARGGPKPVKQPAPPASETAEGGGGEGRTAETSAADDTSAKSAGADTESPANGHPGQGDTAAASPGATAHDPNRPPNE